MAAGFIEFIGGKLGRYAQVGTQRYWTPLRVLLMFAVIFLGLAYLSKAYCLESVLPGAGLGGVGSAGSSGGAGDTARAGDALLNWSGNRQYTAACYSDTIAGYTQFSYSFPYNVPVADAPKSPVLSTLFGWIMYWISGMVGVVVRLVGLQIAPPVVYFAVTAVTLSILWMITVRIMVDLTGSRVWDTLLLTCSPVVIVHAFTHWEILSITTVVGALWCLSRQHFGYAGVFIGLGISAQIWPVFLLLALYIIAGRNDQWWETLRCTEFTILSWAAINIPVAVLFPHTWFRYFVDVYLQMWDWQSGFALLIRETNWLGFDRATTLNLVTVGMFSVLLVMIIAVIAQSPQHTRCPRGHAPATCCVAVEHERVELPVFPMAGANHRASGTEMAAGLCLGSGRSSAMVCAGAAYVRKRPPGAAGRHAGFHVDYPRRFIINAGVGDAA